MTIIYRYILFPKSICPHVTVTCLRSLARDMAVYDRHMTAYDEKGASYSVIYAFVIRISPVILVIFAVVLGT